MMVSAIQRNNPPRTKSRRSGGLLCASASAALLILLQQGAAVHGFSATTTSHVPTTRSRHYRTSSDAASSHCWVPAHVPFARGGKIGIRTTGQFGPYLNHHHPQPLIGPPPLKTNGVGIFGVADEEGNANRLRRLYSNRKSQNSFVRKAALLFCILLSTLSVLAMPAGQGCWASGRNALTTAAATTVSSSSLSQTIIMPPLTTIGLSQVGMAAVLVYCTALATLKTQSSGCLRPLARSLLQGCVRCASQLYLAASVIWTPVLLASTTMTTRPWLVLAVWWIVSSTVAAQEASNRVAYTYPKMRRHFLISLLFSVSVILGITASSLGRVAPTTSTPWYHPTTRTATWIPLMGMLLGHAITATSLACQTLTHELATQTSLLEYALCRGATWREALEPVLVSTYTTALMPTITALGVAGGGMFFGFPGMMTGQLLVGVSAKAAAQYQIWMYFLIAATVTTSVHTMARLTLRSLVDSRSDRLRIGDTTTTSTSKGGKALLQPVVQGGADRKRKRSGLMVFLALVRDQLVRLLEEKEKRESFSGSKKQRQRRVRATTVGESRFIYDDRVIEAPRLFAADEMRLGLCDGKPVGGAQLPILLDYKNNNEDDEMKVINTPAPPRLTTVVRYRTLSPSSSSSTKSDDGDDEIVLQLKDIKMDRSTVSISLDIGSNDIIGIKGPSGIGKSQFLRTLVGLEPLDRTSVWYRGYSAAELPMSVWRQKVALVPQHRPDGTWRTGTPREFFLRALTFHSQQQQQQKQLQNNNSPRPSVDTTSHNNSSNMSQSSLSRSTTTTNNHGFLLDDLSNLVHTWGLSNGALDQPWSTLSGGEAQRMSLAIAIALRPQVLLLDEAMSSLDEATTLLVENTLRSLGIPIFLVSHDTKQLARLSNCILDIIPAGPFSSLR